MTPAEVSSAPQQTSGVQPADHRRGVTAGVGDQARARHCLAIQLSEAVDGFRQQFRRRMLHPVPVGENPGVFEAECPAQVHHFRARSQSLGRRFQRHFVGCGQEHQREAVLAHRRAHRGCVFQGHRAHTTVPGEQAH